MVEKERLLIVSPPVTPDDFERGWTLLEKLWDVGKWLVGAGAAVFIGIKGASKLGIEQRKYEELREDVDDLKDKSSQWLTIDAHEDQQKICQSNIEHMIDVKVHKAVMDMRDEMGVMNANVCKILGAMNIEPMPSNRRKRDG